ncbi:MAG: hypothetical protein HYR62_08450 [Actinobacteria bacterium]|nr:hypothetical protein [Actinomycetota bacterium]MBI3686223.1 hypothetical protein [Actinomycetota bacterium]
MGEDLTPPQVQHGRAPDRVPPGRVVIAPEVAERIVARHTTGESVFVIAYGLHMTPREVRAVLLPAEGGIQ